MSPSAVTVVVLVLLLAARRPWAVRRAGRLSAPVTCAGRAAAPGRARRRGEDPGSVLDPALVLELCAAAVRSGAPVPRALVVVGDALGGTEGDGLARAGAALDLGADWGAAWAGAPPAAAAVGAALQVGWTAGAAPGPQLRAAADVVRRERRSAVRAACGALGARLTLPLGACFLPAFVLLGLVPVVVALAGDVLG